MLGLNQDVANCPQLPGNYSVQCGNRRLRVFWVPPKDDSGDFIRAVPTFRRVGAARFTSFADQLRPPGSTGREYDHNGTTPHTEYEFGLNHVTSEGVVSIPPQSNKNYQPCHCLSPPDIPDPPTHFNCHYVRDNDYTCDWVPGSKHGSDIETYRLQYKRLNTTHPDESNEWEPLIDSNSSAPHLNFTLPTRSPVQLQLNAVNGMGPSESIFKLLKPPINQFNADRWKITNMLTYGALGLAGVIFLLLLIAVIAYKRRRDFSKGKKPCIINFTRTRLLNGSLQDTSFAATKTTSISGTGGLPMELSTFEPIWNQELNSLYGDACSGNNEIYQGMHIPSTQIRFMRYIGCGAFGKVWEGCLYSSNSTGEERFERVALKVRNVKSLTESEFKREAMLMRRYQHTNIVGFYGVSLDTPSQQCLVLELMELGNLREYLHKARPRITSVQAENISRKEHSRSDRGSSRQTATLSENNTQESALSGSKSTTGGGVELHCLLQIPDLVNIMHDIAQGCQYLEEQHFVHRDIAARNCLVSHKHPSGRIVKLCDFGLARDIYKNDYYRKRNEPKLPVRWMSPEAILEGLFTSKSDVWAYAVTCWEVMSLGADPFYGQVNLEVINLVLGGNVLSKPDNCPDMLYDHLLQCWSRFPEIRPTFTEVCKTMVRFIDMSKVVNSPFSGPYIYKLPTGGSTNQQSTLSTPTADWRTTSSHPVRNDSDVNLLNTDSLCFDETVKSSSQQQNHNGLNRVSSQDFSGISHSPIAGPSAHRQHSCPDGEMGSWSAGRSTGDDVTTDELGITNAHSLIPHHPSVNLQRHSSCRPYINSSPITPHQRGMGNCLIHPYTRNPLPSIVNKSFTDYYNRSLIMTRQPVRRQQSDYYRRFDSAEVDSMGYERPVVGGTFERAPLRHLNAGAPLVSYTLPYNNINQQITGSPQYAIPAPRPFQLPPIQGGRQMVDNQGNYGIMHRSLHLDQQDAFPIPLQQQQPNSAMFQSGQFDFRNLPASGSGTAT